MARAKMLTAPDLPETCPCDRCGKNTWLVIAEGDDVILDVEPLDVTEPYVGIARRKDGWEPARKHGGFSLDEPMWSYGCVDNPEGWTWYGTRRRLNAALDPACEVFGEHYLTCDGYNEQERRAKLHHHRRTEEGVLSEEERTRYLAAHSEDDQATARLLAAFQQTSPRLPSEDHPEPCRWRQDALFDPGEARELGADQEAQPQRQQLTAERGSEQLSLVW